MSCTQVYTGEGKGKTTASLGLLLRACGAGMKACVFQFLKKGDYSELASMRLRFPDVKIEQFGSGKFITDVHNIPREEMELAARGFARAREAVLSGAYDLVILDEANTAMAMGLLSVDDMLELMASRPERTELVLTGRDAPQAIIDAADLCTEMRMVKHYYQRGVQARKGIEF